jgi:hypothetical protein
VYSFDGLERLIVFAVGLDVAIAQSSSSADLETRSQLYRALTRSHMLAVVINEVLQGGWLEFLGMVKLEEGASFDRVAERKRMNEDAVEALVAERLKLIDAALKEVSASTAVQEQQRLGSVEVVGFEDDVVLAVHGGEAVADAVSKAMQAKAKLGQTVWDTGANAISRSVGELVFNPFGEMGAAKPGHEGSTT